MSLKELGIVHKQLDEMLIASIRFGMHQREEALPKFEKLVQHCKDYICGPGFIIYHWGTGIKPFDIEAGFPVTQPVEMGEITSRVLEKVEALTLFHLGSYETINESFRKLYGYMEEHGIIGAPSAREIFLEANPDLPEENVTECQTILLGWEERFVGSVERILGIEAKETITEGVEELTVESSVEQRAKWLKAAIERLDALADEDQRYQILSPCGHIFSKERIAHMRAIYERKQNIDDVLEAMREDPEWYESPVRKGNVVYVGKIPYNPEGYKAAKTAAEKKRHYCHCSMIRDSLDDISSTFCYCGAGWYRQQWEGVLGKPVKIELLKSLAKGDDECYFAIHLPPEVVLE